MKSAAFGPDWLHSRLAALLPGYPDVSVCVALSGGVDSVALLVALAGIRDRRNRLRAIHVHHGLHPNADRWTAHCRKLAARYRIPLKTVRVKVSIGKGASLEAAARDARYAALARELKPGEVLLTAHHQDDQLETVFLQLLRGAGIAGLAAMPEVAPFAAGQLARPLLTRSRAELEEWAREQALQWIDDDTNSDERLDRNHLRRSILPLIRARWPGAAAAVSRSARHAAEARRLLDSIARMDVERAADGPALSVRTLRTLDLVRRKNALRYWIAAGGRTVPDSRRLDEMASTLFDARSDANPSVQWERNVVQRHGGLLTLTESATDKERGEILWEWRARPSLELNAGGGTLEIRDDPHGPVDLDQLPPILTVRQRKGGERLRPRIGGPTRTLKTLLQESRTSLATRERLPLLFFDDRLLAVADIWLDASIQFTPSTRRRARIVWRPRS